MARSSDSSMSMFQRRVVLLGVLMAAGAVVPLIRTASLTLARGEALRAEAERKLVTYTWVSTTRGKIIDRKARVLARDVPAFDVKVDYSIISGQWAYNEAARRARKEHKAWNELSAIQRDRIVRGFLPEYEARLKRAWESLADACRVPFSEIERTRGAIVERVTKMAAEVTESSRRQAQIDALQRGRELTMVETADVAKPIREQEIAHVVVRGIDDATAFDFPRGEDALRAGLLEGMRLSDGAERDYPLDEVHVSIDRTGFPAVLKSDRPLEITVRGVATPIVGSMRNTLYREDVERRPLRRKQDGVTIIDPGGYIEGDSVGQNGMEAVGEDDLRGLRGSVTEQLDTGAKTEVARQEGHDVAVTIDASLQARIAALMSPDAGLTTIQQWQGNKALAVGTHLQSGVVVLDVDTSEILALVSTPTYTREQLRSDPESIFVSEADRAMLDKARAAAEAKGEPEPSAAGMVPLLNRAIGRAYAPGSIVKPLILSAAVTEGEYDVGTRIACNGHFYPDKPTMMRCWIFKQLKTTHSAVLGHDLDGAEGIMASCNIFFFTLGHRLGPEKMLDWYAKFGVGDGPNVKRGRLGIGYQYAGAVGTIERSDLDDEELDEPHPKGPRRTVTPSEATLMGIGQGPIAWTPLHAADAYATLARGGERIVPRLRMTEPEVRENLGLKSSGVAMALRGLDRCVNDPAGTGHHISYTTFDGIPIKEATFNLPGVKVWGKSGTADSGIRGELNKDASVDHSWFVVLVGPEGGKPRYAVSVLVENGGSGGRVAGPLCNQVLWALRAEGYL